MSWRSPCGVSKAMVCLHDDGETRTGLPRYLRKLRKQERQYMRALLRATTQASVREETSIFRMRS
jgi:hypothetical protein